MGIGEGRMVAEQRRGRGRDNQRVLSGATTYPSIEGFDGHIQNEGDGDEGAPLNHSSRHVPISLHWKTGEVIMGLQSSRLHTGTWVQA